MTPSMRLLTLLLFAFTPVHGQNWPMYLLDSNHSSYNWLETTINQTNIKDLAPVWTAQIGAPMAAAVTVVDGVLYIGSWDGKFRALKADDGTVLWEAYVGVAPAPEQPWCMPGVGPSAQATVDGDTVYVGGGDSAVYAFNRHTGELLWQVTIADPSTGAYIWSSLQVYKNSLYLAVASLGDCPLTRGLIAKIDLNDPQKPLIKYLVPEGQMGGGIFSTPAIDQDTNTIYATTGTGEQNAEDGTWGGTMLAFDADTLEIKRHYFLPTNSAADDIHWGSSPTLFKDAEGRALVAASGKDGILYALRREDLSVVWTLQVAIGCICPECGCGSLSTPAFDGVRLYHGAGAAPDADVENGSIYAIDPATGEIIWKRLLTGTIIAPVTVANGVVFAATLRGMETFSTDTGETLWASDLRATIYSQPVVCNGTLYNTFLNGAIIAWRPPEPPKKEEPPSSLLKSTSRR